MKLNELNNLVQNDEFTFDSTDHRALFRYIHTHTHLASILNSCMLSIDNLHDVIGHWQCLHAALHGWANLGACM